MYCIKANQECEENWLFNVLNHFPIPIEVFNSEGLCIFINKEFIEFFCVSDPSMIVGKTKIIHDVIINEKMSTSEYLNRVFSGEPLSFDDVRVPFDAIADCCCRIEKHPDNDIYQKIISFPILNQYSSPNYAVALFITKNIYQSRLDTRKAKEYIDKHWMEDYNTEKIAEYTGLCSQYLARLFKKFMGITPYSYYQNVKIEKIKEALRNPKLSIREAFISCGVDYSGGIADVFKRRTGMTPSMYRRTFLDRDIDEVKQVEQHNNIRVNYSVDTDDFKQKLFQYSEYFPVPIQIYKTNGDIAYINNAVLRMWNLLDRSQILENYNLFRDPQVLEHSELNEGLKRAFQGETVLIQDVRIPLESYWEWLMTRTEPYDIEAVYTDILNFPIKNEIGKMIYLVSIFFTSRIYQGKSEIAKAKEFIENNWREEFDIEKISKAVCLSPSHLVRLFKINTGMTPHKYYKSIKVVKLKAALLDTNLSVAEVFSSCGFEYSGNNARFFKTQVGMTPSEYRKSIK